MNKQDVNFIDRSHMFYWQTDRRFSPQQVKEIFLDRHLKFDKSEAIAAVEYGMKQAGKKDANVIKLNNIIVFGSVNIVCRATLQDGLPVIIRMHPPKVKNGYFWVESIASKKAKEIGVPTYETYFIDDSQTKFDFDYALLECLRGENIKNLWPLEQDLEIKLIKETGMYLAKIHSISTQNFGFFSNQNAKVKKELAGIHTFWKDHVFASFSENLDFLQQTKLISSEQRKKIERIFFQNQHLLKLDMPKLIHNDVADWNELAVGNKVTGIIDWDECYSGDPVCDFSTWSVFFPFERMEYLKKGYQKISPLPDAFDEKLHLYRVRYIISKAVLRKKKLLVSADKQIKEMLQFAMKSLEEEFLWYGV